MAPVSFSLRVREHVDTGEVDDFNEPILSWVERDWSVRSIAPGSMEEPDRTSRDLSVVMWTLYADKGEEPNEAAQIRLPGSPDWYEIEGRPKDWTLGPDRVGPTGPFPSNPPGIVVELRRANG